MTITSFTELQDAVSTYLARDDFSGETGTFVQLAEARIGRTIRTREMEETTSISLSSGSGSLPADYLEWISAQWVGTRTQDLRYVEPDSEEWRFRYRPGGDPSMFTIEADTIKVRPTAAGSITLSYYKAIPALSASNSTNWLLEKSPDIYLNYSLAEAYIRMKDHTRAKDFMQLAAQELQSAIVDGDGNKVARRPSRTAEAEDIAATRNPTTSGR